MKIKTVTITLAILFTVLVGAGLYVRLYPDVSRNLASDSAIDALFGWKFPVAKFPSTGPGDRLVYSDIRDPGGIPQGLPVRLKIPIIGVDSAIEDALITPDGRMDVPAGSVNVAWFSLGPYPGQEGSAVIGGHFGISKGIPFVFYNLDKLKVGDNVYIVDDKNATITFRVRSIKSFDRNADATTVFTSNDGLAHLNLITCEGVWNRVNDTYPQRLVVFTDAISAAEAAVPTPPPAVVYRSLSIGSRGADVVELQNALIQKGLLKIPPGVAKGYFGTLTRAAVARYQTSVGLSPLGVFNAPTRAKLIAEASSVEVKTVFPETALVPLGGPAASAPLLNRLVKSVAGTPMDALVTLLLIFSILLVTFRLIRK